MSARERDFYVLQTGYGAHITFLSGRGVDVKNGPAVNLTTPLDLAPKLGITGAVHILPPT